MIKSITLKRFGKHKDLHLEFSPGVNTIVGKSSKGKSWAVPRALRQIVFNRPLGDGYVYDPVLAGEAGETYDEPTEIIVELLQLDGSTITVKKVKKANDHFYSILEPGNKERVFRSFGNNPPDEIKELLNMSDLNFASQHQPLYLLSMSAPEVGRVLNDLAGLEDIDQAYSYIGSRINKEKAEVSKQKAFLEKHENDLEKFTDLEALDQAVTKLEYLKSRSNQLDELSTTLSSVISRHEDVTDLIKGYQSLESLESRTKTLSEIMTSSKSVGEQSTKLDNLIKSLIRCDQLIEGLSAYDDLIIKLKRVEELIQTYKDKTSQDTVISTLIQSIQSSQVNCDKVEKEHKKLEEEFEKSWTGMCPIFNVKCANGLN